MKSWFITGAASGIGRAVAEKVLARGDRVVAAVRQPDALNDLRAAHDEQLKVVAFDVTDTAGMRREVDRAFADQRIEVVFSNAGYGLFGAAEEVTDAQIDRQIATNLVGSIQFIRACLPHLRRQGGGRILQTSSEGGQFAYPSFGLYHATKWGIEGFVEAVALEVASWGIDMVLVEPGPTPTRFRANVDAAPAMNAYRDTPAGQVRAAAASGGFPATGDLGRCADAIVIAADTNKPERRLVLGGVAYTNIERSLALRLDAVRNQKAAAFAADRPEAS